MANVLGKGLESLIPGWNEKDENITNIDIEKILPYEAQPRKDFDEEKLKDLAESIKENGFIQPIVVTRNGDVFNIIAGERRYRASKIAGIKKIPAIIKNYKEEEKFEISLIENIQRENLNPIEEAEAYRYLMSKYNLNQEALAKKIKKSRSSIANTMRIKNLPETVQKEILVGKISKTQARTLASIDNEVLQNKLAKQVLQKEVTVRDLEAIARKTKSSNGGIVKNNIKPTIKKPEDIKAIEDKLREKLGTKIEIDFRANGEHSKGSIKIYFSSIKQAEDIIKRIK